jgi:hypothetical protein
MEDEEDFELLIKKKYYSIEKDITNNDNYNNNNYESTIIINTMGYGEDFEPPTKKIKLRTMPVDKENDYNPVLEPRSIITEEYEEDFEHPIKKKYSSIEKDNINNNNNNNINDDNYESTIIINTMGYRGEYFEPTTKKIKLSKENDCNIVV